MDKQLTLGQRNQNDNGTIEIVTQVRDVNGKSTGKTKSYTSDSPFKVWQFYMRNKGKPKKKKEKGLPAGQDAAKLIQEVNENAEVKHAERIKKQEEQHGE